MPDLMTLPELADYLRFTRKTIYSLLKQGKIPAIKIGRKWRFDREIIDKWLRQGVTSNNACILVIDDDLSVRTLFEAALREQGHTVVTVATGSEAIEMVRRDNYDLVFLDLRLPDIDGAEVFREIRSVNPLLMVIIITGYPDSQIMARAMKQGPFGVMNKPFDDSDIINATNSFLHVNQRKE